MKPQVHGMFWSLSTGFLGTVQFSREYSAVVPGLSPEYSALKGGSTISIRYTRRQFAGMPLTIDAGSGRCNGESS